MGRGVNGERGIEPLGCFPCFSALERIAVVYWNSADFVLAVINSLCWAGGKVGSNFLRVFYRKAKGEASTANR